MFLTSEVGTCTEVTYTECCEGQKRNWVHRDLGQICKGDVQQKLLAQ